MSKKLNKSSYSGGVLPGVDNSPAYSPITTKVEGGAEVDKLHKQPRGYLKTTAKIVGKATEEATLFSLPEKKQRRG